MSLTSEELDPFRDVPAATTTTSLAKARDYLVLTKPRVMSLVVFTAIVALVAAPAHVEPMVGILTILCIAVGAGAAGALNMWHDADIDALMRRTALRPIPRGRVSPKQVLGFGLAAAAVSVVALGWLTNAAAAGLLAFTIFFYAAVYTIWLKRSTPQSIVIGGAAGASPPVIAWVAVTGQVDLEPLLLFLVVFFWTPPHFWALSLNRAGDYRRAGIPALPVIAGERETQRRILIYTLLLFATSLLPWFLGFGRALYAAVAVTSGAVMIGLAVHLWRICEARSQAGKRLFAFSVWYLILLFAALLIEKLGAT